MNKLNRENSVIKDDVNIKCYYLVSGLEERCKKFIKPCSKKRDWMNQPGLSYSYYCGPLVAANQIGYNIIYQNETEIFWNGGPNRSDIDIRHTKVDEHFCVCDSHFEVDILTFNFPVMFQTPKGWGLLISGPANHPIEGLQPLEGLVETNWLPFTFTMNFKITEKNKLIKIKQYTPICRVLPYPLNLNEKTNLNFLDIQSNKKLLSMYTSWANARDEFNAKEREDLSDRDFFYRDGKDSQGNLIAEGMHKLDYKFDFKDDSIKKCPFLSRLFKFKIK